MRKLLFLLALLFSLPALAQGHDGTIMGSPLFGGQGTFGQAIYNLSDSNYVSLPSGSCPTTNTFTAEVRFNISTVPSSQLEIMLSCGGTTSDNFYIGVNNAGHLVIGDGAGFYDTGLTYITGNSGYNFVRVVRTATGMTPYLGCTAGPTHTPSSPYTPLGITSGRIGAHIYGGYSFQGAVDEVQFTSVDKSTSGCTVPTAPYTGTEPNTVSLYHLDGNATDSTGGTSTGTPAASTTTIDPSNSGILYSPFNWSVQAGAAKTINSGAYFRTLVNSTSFALTFDMSNAGSPYSEFWCRIDDQGWSQFSIASNVNLGSGYAARKHLLECIVKSTSQNLSRWSPSQTMVSMTGLVIDQGGTVTLPLRKSKNILIYGDSITEGVRTQGNQGADTDTNDVLSEYSYALTQLDAEVGIVAFGGLGVSGGGTGGVPNLAGMYNYVLSGVPRSFSSPAPDVVLYNLGQNDGNAAITSAFTSTVNAVHAAAPNAKQLLIEPFSGNQAANVQATAAATGSTYIDTTGWFSSADASDGVHPYGYISYGVLGPKLLPFVTQALYPSTGTSTPTTTRSYTFY